MEIHRKPQSSHASTTQRPECKTAVRNLKHCKKDKFSLHWMKENDAWRILNTRIHNAMLARWQILKAAARNRDYKGPTDNAEISKDPDKARSAWTAWIISDVVNMDWLRVQMHILLKKEKFHDLREIVMMLAK